VHKFKVGDIVCLCDEGLLDSYWRRHKSRGEKYTVIRSSQFYNGFPYVDVRVVGAGDEYSIYEHNLEFSVKLTPEEKEQRKYEEISEKAAKLWGKQQWVVDGMPQATYYIKQPAPSVEKVATIEQETISPYIQTDTSSALDALLLQDERESLELWIERMTRDTLIQATIGRQQFQLGPILGLGTTTSPFPRS
jgi:hypothetical protein